MTDIQELASESAIRLAKWQVNIASINPTTYPRANTIGANNQRIRSDIFEKLRNQPYAYENFLILLSLKDSFRVGAHKDKLQEIYEKTMHLKNVINTDFGNKQIETIGNILKENGGRMRDAQDAYIRRLDVTAGRIFEGDDIGQHVFSSPSGWGFKSMGQQTYSNQDMPYGNWRDNIAELVVERIDCFIDFFEKLLHSQGELYITIPNGRRYSSTIKGPIPEDYEIFCDNKVLCRKGYEADGCSETNSKVECKEDITKSIERLIEQEGKRIVRGELNPNESYIIVYDYRMRLPPLKGVTKVIDKGDYYEYMIGNKQERIRKQDVGSFLKGGKRRIRKTMQRNRNKRHKRKTKRTYC